MEEGLLAAGAAEFFELEDEAERAVPKVDFGGADT